MTIERGLALTEFVDLLTLPVFQERVLEIARFTVSTGMEGALAVYKSPETGGLSVCEPLLPTAEDAQKTLEMVNGSRSFWDGLPLDMQDAMAMMDILPLIEDEDKDLRRDVVMTMHSHPSTNEGSPWDYLRPSLQDVETFAYCRGRNPRLIDGILEARDKLAKLKLYRESSTVPFSYFHDYVNDEPFSAGAMETLLHDNGFNTAVVEFDLAKKRMVSDPDTIAEQLFA